MQQSKVFSRLRSAGYSVAKAGAVVAVLGTSSAAMALSDAQNTTITTGFSSVETTVALIIAGILGVVLAITGISYILGLLRR